MTEALNALAANIVSRHKAGADPYVLFLGAGASISSGCSSMLTMTDDLLQSHDSGQLNSWEAEVIEAQNLSATFGDLQRREINEKKVARFYEIWGTLDIESKYAFLRKHLRDGKVPSNGYLDLAYLVRSGYFKTILTTNLDALVEKALIKVGMLPPDDFTIVVNGKDSPGELSDQLENPRSPVRIVKLHGTLESPLSYAFTPEEIFSFEKSIRPAISRILNQSLIILGHSMQDRDINTLFEEDVREIHFVNPVAPRRGSSIENVLAVRGLGSSIVGPDGHFDNFFAQLRAEVERTSNTTLTRDFGPSIEGFLESIGLEAELKAPRSRYKNLHSLYVKPTEYDEILSKLENDHIVFIVGEPHMGKTYTALYLLWEYHQQGYETVHVRHDQLRHLLHRFDNDLKELLLELFAPKNQKPRIVHFDDPFGETSRRRTEAVTKGLKTFVGMARSYEHLRVIVTSRLNIFNEALAEHSYDGDLRQLEKTLRVHTSYRREVLLDIFHRYVNFYTPAWARDEKIMAQLDEKLPSMLPAPHNIEFFVSTSESLTSWYAVLSHVEESKKMISALAGWMKHLAPHEQIFLMWVEICSTVNILFPETPASEIIIENAFKRNLAYLFAEGHLAGIPTVPFSTARDQFETILIERRTSSMRGRLRLDFVHPSYHEAFWYAVSRRFRLANWWELLIANVREIFPQSESQIDTVQLRMIERYGTINRNLDQLLLLSAASNDSDEQLIALGHMLKRPEQFASLPQFVACVTRVVSAPKASVRRGFLSLYDRHFQKLPLEALRPALPLTFDEDREVRLKAKNVIGSRIGLLPRSLHEEKAFKQWRVLAKLVESASGLNPLDYFDAFPYEELANIAVEKVVNLDPEEIQLLAQLRAGSARELTFWLFNTAWKKLSREQRHAIPVAAELASDDADLRNRVDAFVANHSTAYLHLTSHPVIKDLIKLAKAFSLTLDEDIHVTFRALPIKSWPHFSGEELRKLASIDSLDVGLLVTASVLEKHHEFSAEDGARYLKALYTPDPVPSLDKYIADHRSDSPARHYPTLSEAVLLALLNADGYVQYEVLTALLLRFETLSEYAQTMVRTMVHEQWSWWIGASVGQLCMNSMTGKLSGSVEQLPFMLAGLDQKRKRGALLAEIAQCYFDQSLGLQAQYEKILLELIKDTDIVAYAQEWMWHSEHVFELKDEQYWRTIKQQMRWLRQSVPREF